MATLKLVRKQDTKQQSQTQAASDKPKYVPRIRGH